MNNTCSSGQIGAASFLQGTCVLIPALNESSCVALTVARWLDLGVARVRVIDNGSTDDTRAAARAAGAEVFLEPQRGYGAAVWAGLQRWPLDISWVLFSSADGSDRLAPTETHAFQQAVDAGADLIVGDRVSPRDSRANLKWSQRLGNRITCEAIRLGWKRRFKDMGSLRLVRYRDLIRLALKDRGFGWNVEMQIRALEHDWQIVEVPVRYYPRLSGDSKISGSLAGTMRAGKGILQMLALLWMLKSKRATVARARDKRQSARAADS